MVDNEALPFPANNIRSLLHQIGMGVDHRLQEMRAGSRYANVRNSDTKVFMSAYRKPGTVADIARALDVSRQAVHASVKRLQAIKVVELQPQPHNHRDKLVVITDRGRHAQGTAIQQINSIEEQMATVIGENGLQQLRQSLVMLSDAFRPK